MADDRPEPTPPDSSAELNAGDLFAHALGSSERRRGGPGWQPPSVEDLRPELPQFEIFDLIGRGGMGTVYKGRQRSLDRYVAIKILPGEFASGDAEYAVRFQREARAMARLSHPSIVAVHDAGETPGGLLYFVMDYVQGTDVQQMLATGGRLPLEEALRITTCVCDALAYAHGKGIIHRDIKPSNVMVDSDGQVKVADFGLAKDASTHSSLLTASDAIMGTPDFMAPESLLGTAQVDHRADLYAIGVMLYQTLTGKLPRGRFEPPSRLVPGLDRRLDAIVDRTLQNERDARFSSALELRTALAPVLTHTLALSSASPRPRRKPALLAGFAAVSVATAFVLFRPSPQVSSPGAPGGDLPKLEGTDPRAVASASASAAALVIELGGDIEYEVKGRRGRGRAVPEGDFRLTSVSLSHQAKIRANAADLAVILATTSLEDLSLFGAEGLNDANGLLLAELHNLRTLSLQATDAQDGWMRYIAKLPLLESLALPGTLVSDIGIAQLSGLSSLRKLDITGTAITPDALARLPQIVALEKIAIGTGSESTDHHAQILIPVAAALKDLTLNGPLSAPALKGIGQLALLENLQLSKSALTAAHFRHLKDLPVLESLSLHSSTVSDDAWALLPEIRSLRRLTLKGVESTPALETALARFAVRPSVKRE